LVATSAFSAGRERVEDASLAVHAGELVVVTGGRGAGTSLLLRLAAGRQPPAAGEVWLGGDELGRLRAGPRAAAVRLIGYGGPDTPLLGGASLLENVMLPEIARGRGRVAASASAFSVLSAVDLAPCAATDVASLDAGERRLALVARACVGRPRLCVVDEPSVDLADDDAERVLHLLRMRAAQGTAVLVSSRDPAFLARAERLGAKTVAMEAGRLLPARGMPGWVVTTAEEAPARETEVRVEVIR
jgi:ABC-type ATPase involved in cell division